jgi:hypothetical protein
MHFNYKNHLSNEFMNRFASSFWIERQWFFEVKIKDNRISYSIRPYKYILNVSFIDKLTFLFRNVWLDTYKNAEMTTYCNGNIDDNSIQPIQLHITKNHSVTLHESFLDKLKSNFVGVQFTHLIINCENISIGLLVNIIHLLPSLVSSKVSSLQLIEPDCLFDDDG